MAHGKIGHPGGVIDKFKASIARAGGFARPTRYEVVLTAPQMLKEQYPEIDILEQDIGLQCNTISMPGHDLQTQAVKYGSAPVRDMVTSHGYAGDVVASFYLDRALKTKMFFDAWQSLAVDMATHKANYYSDYVGTMKIYQLSSIPWTETTITTKEDVSGGSRDHRTSKHKHGMVEEKYNTYKTIRTHGMKVEEVYPATIGAIEYAYISSAEVAKLAVEFQYRKWETIRNWVK